MPKARPFVLANFALTWDGKISTRNRTPATFSSKNDKRRLLEIRATADAILVGRTTIERDNMRMGLSAADLRAARVRQGKPAYPMRVIVSNSGRVKSSLRVFEHDFSPIIIYSTRRMPRRIRERLSGKATLHLKDGDGIDLDAMLRHLRAHYRVRRVVCEGGATLFRALLQKNLVDEINVTFCPLVFGGEKAPTLTGLPGNFLPRTVHCRLVDLKVENGECFARYRVRR
jgi:riboflavin-specific deaminase-like protein